MENLRAIFQSMIGLGLDNERLTVPQMALRAAIVFIVTLLFVRLAKKRFMSQATAFDFILGVMLGSLASRAITGNAPFFPAMVASITLIGMHWLLSWSALHSHTIGILTKGRPRVLIRDGHLDRSAMSRSHITDYDLQEDLRSRGVLRPEQVVEAHLERSGTVSVVPRREPRILDIHVQNGVQVVRLQIG